MGSNQTPKADGLRALRERKLAERRARVTLDDLRAIQGDASERANVTAAKKAAKRAARKHGSN